MYSTNQTPVKGLSSKLKIGLDYYRSQLFNFKKNNDWEGNNEILQEVQAEINKIDIAKNIHTRDRIFLNAWSAFSLPELNQDPLFRDFAQDMRADLFYETEMKLRPKREALMKYEIQ